MSKPPNRGQREDRRCRGAADEALRLGGCTSCPGPWRRGQGGRRVGWHRSKVDGRPTTSSIHSTAAGAGHLDSRPLDLTKLSSPSSSPPPPPPLNVAGAGAAIGVGAGLVEIHIVLLLSPGADQPRHGGANDVRTQSVCCAWGRVGKAKVEWLDGWREFAPITQHARRRLADSHRRYSHGGHGGDACAGLWACCAAGMLFRAWLARTVGELVLFRVSGIKHLARLKLSHVCPSFLSQHLALQPLLYLYDILLYHTPPRLLLLAPLPSRPAPAPRPFSGPSNSQVPGVSLYNVAVVLQATSQSPVRPPSNFESGLQRAPALCTILSVSAPGPAAVKAAPHSELETVETRRESERAQLGRPANPNRPTSADVSGPN
ncbi:hypothetical protein HDK90DRAFT_461866 [Phyllosticta capitalensis]|uniref:Uncharacterized protein n=1 Tax=Phyllosticta capitalensis TaxID=121624 RepID=A0ABR1Z3U4_9PEZI